MPASPEIAPLRSRWLHGLSPSTARSYAIDTAAWLSWCARADVDPLRPADADLAEYLSEISGLAPSTRARRLCGIRSFYVWLHQEGIVAHVPSAPLAERPGTGADAPGPCA